MVVVVLAGMAWWGGLLGPNLHPIHGAGWSTHDDVEVAAWAHHSFAIFDFETKIEFEGVVESIKFRNPHIEMTITVTDVEVLPPSLTGAVVEVVAAVERLEPGEERTVELELTVTDCEAFQAPSDDVGLTVRARSGVVPRTVTARYVVGIERPATWQDRASPSSVWNTFAEPVCDAAWDGDWDDDRDGDRDGDVSAAADELVEGAVHRLGEPAMQRMIGSAVGPHMHQM